MVKLGIERWPDSDFADPRFLAEDNPTIQYCITHDQWENTQCNVPA